MFKKNQTVNIFNTDLEGRHIFEGKAIIVSKLNNDEHDNWYKVRFEDDGIWNRRVIAGETQDNPEKYLESKAIMLKYANGI